MGSRVKPKRMSSLVAPALGAGLLVLLTQLPTEAQDAKDPMEKALDRMAKENRELAKSQDKIHALSDETGALVTEYRNVQRRIEALGVYNNQLSTLLASQQKELDSLRNQIDNVTVVGRQITPLMLRMIDSLEKFVELDVPFLVEERAKRVSNLRTLMNRSDVEDSEKFRRLLEAYQIENDYGRTIESYRGPLVDGKKKKRTVDYLRVGRVVLVYRTLGGGEAGVWDQKAHKWRPMDRDAMLSLPEALRIARKQAAPNLIRLPVPAAEKIK